jgi:hypothetical protein
MIGLKEAHLPDKTRQFDQHATTAAAGGDELRGIIKIASRPGDDWSRVRAGVLFAAAARNMSLHGTLGTIIKDYPKARNEPFAGKPLATFIRQEAATTVEAKF